MLEQGYGMIPNKVLYSTELSDKQKLLFCTISSLCAKEGFCRATNEFLGELLNADKRTISRNITALEEKGYIAIEIDSNSKRKITLDKNVEGDRQKCLGGIDKNVYPYIYMNNTNEYIYSKYYGKKKGIDEKVCNKLIDDKLKQGITLEQIYKSMILYNSECMINQEWRYVQKFENWIKGFQPLTDEEMDTQLYTVIKLYRDKKKSDDKFGQSTPAKTLWNDLKTTFGEEKVKGTLKQVNTINLSFT